MKQRALVVTLPLLVLAAAMRGQPAQPWIGQAAPSFALPTLDGKAVSLADFKGKFLVLHFGAGW